MATPRWILAFDASCGSCAALAGTVQQESGGRLDLRALTDPQVEQWRERAFPDGAPWVPTLLRVTDDQVRAWTGRALPFRLVRLLGPGPAWRVLAALGDLSGGAGRPRWRRLLAGLRVVLRMVVTGNLPPLRTDLERWASDHRTPIEYDDLDGLSLDRRRALFRVATPQNRSRLWTTQLQGYLADHPELDDAARTAVEAAGTLLSDPAYFGDGGVDDEQDRQIVAATAALENALGRDETTRLVTVLGRADTVEPGVAVDCACATASDWCSSPTRCRTAACTPRSGCGAFWSYTCNGRCS